MTIKRRIRVMGLGETWAHPAHERYGAVMVEIYTPHDPARSAPNGGQSMLVYSVGCVIGVPESDRGTVAALGQGEPEWALDAWYADASDWSEAEAGDGRGALLATGIPADLADEVLSAIRGQAPRLWRELEEGEG